MKATATEEEIAINQTGVTQCYYLEQAGFIHLPGFIQQSSHSSESDSQKETVGAESGGDEIIRSLNPNLWIRNENTNEFE